MVDEIELTIMDRGRRVPVHIGDRVVLSLPEGTSGMRWILPKSDAVQVLADVNTPPGGPGVGAEGLRVLTLRPRRAGTISLQLFRGQEWDKDVPADEHFEIELDAS